MMEFKYPAEAMRARVLHGTLNCGMCKHMHYINGSWCKRRRYAPNPRGIKWDKCICPLFRLAQEPDCSWDSTDGPDECWYK